MTTGYKVDIGHWKYSGVNYLSDDIRNVGGAFASTEIYIRPWKGKQLKTISESTINKPR